MPINHEEIIEDMEGQIRKCGGAWEEWCVGTAKDPRGPFFRRHLAADLGDGLAYREAYTTVAAQAVVDHLINNRGLQLDQEAELGSTLTAHADLKVGATQAPRAVPEPGKIVFVYRRTRDSGFGVRDSGLGIRDSGERGSAQGTPQPAPAALRSDHAAFPRRAA